MVVRDNQKFREIMRKFDANQSIILYSLWDGYRTKEGSRLPEFLNSTGHWEPLHTSGHVSQKDIPIVIEKTSPDAVIPIHTDKPEMLQTICQNTKIVLLKDGEEYYVQ